LSPGAKVTVHLNYVKPTKFKTGGLHEKHVMATWNLGSQRLQTKKNLCRDGKNLCRDGKPVSVVTDRITYPDKTTNKVINFYILIMKTNQ
jgi:hypothetical protein